MPGVTAVAATFRSLSVNYDSLVTTGAELEQAVAALMKTRAAASHNRRLWEIPACYDPQFAPDIEDVARSAGLTPAEVAALHAGTQYHVYMIGFVPGYPYMGDLPEQLRLPRRTDPRTRVPPGSVAIATSMTAVYPYESPGGWHLIGTSPVRFFDPGSPSGALLSPGDAVKFQPVTAQQFAEHQACRRAQRLCARQARRSRRDPALQRRHAGLSLHHPGRRTARLSARRRAAGGRARPRRLSRLPTRWSETVLVPPAWKSWARVRCSRWSRVPPALR